MKLHGLGPSHLHKLAQALRENEPAHLVLEGAFPTHLRASEIVPLLASFHSDSPELNRSVQGHLPPQGRADAPTLSVSAIIPTNRGTPIGLASLRSQDCDMEVLVLNNGGLDAEGDRVERVAWEGHGQTRQRGVEMARGDYILFTVDDAIPQGAGCIRTLVQALEEGGYDAVFGRQLPWPGADPITHRRLRTWTPPGTRHRRVEQLDHVFALYRRETLLRHPLPSVPIGEDLHWRQGRRIGYVPLAPVLHSHERTPAMLYARTRDLHLQHLALGEAPRVPSTLALASALPALVEPLFTAGPREIPNQVAELLGQWRAARIVRKQPTP